MEQLSNNIKLLEAQLGGYFIINFQENPDYLGVIPNLLNCVGVVLRSQDKALCFHIGVENIICGEEVLQKKLLEIIDEAFEPEEKISSARMFGGYENQPLFIDKINNVFNKILKERKNDGIALINNSKEHRNQAGKMLGIYILQEGNCLIFKNLKGEILLTIPQERYKKTLSLIEKMSYKNYDKYLFEHKINLKKSNNIVQEIGKNIIFNEKINREDNLKNTYDIIIQGINHKVKNTFIYQSNGK